MGDSNLNLYKVFCVTAESRNFAEAGEKLFVAPTTISSHIRNLEAILNVKLFYRERDGVVLTDEGQELYDDLKDSIKQIEFAEKKLMMNNDILNAKITIGCPSHLALSYLSTKIKEIREEYPNLKVAVIGASDYAGLIDMLKKHTVDFIILDVVPNDVKKELQLKPLKEIQNVFIYNKPLKLDDIKELEKYKFILNYNNSVSIKELFELLDKEDVHINADIQADITELRIDAVKQGLGIAYVIEDAILKDKEVYEVKLPVKLPKMKINLVYNEKYLTDIDRIFMKKYLK